MNGRNSGRLWSGILMGVALVGAIAPPTHALVVVKTEGTTFAPTDPADDFGFDHMGKRASATAVYLGYGWMLTATHADAGTAEPVELNGVVYDYVANSERTLSDPTGTTPRSDLRLFQVRDAATHQLTPRMTPLTISATRPDVGSTVTMVGRGRARSNPLYAWHVAGGFPGGGTWIWDTSPHTPPLYDPNELRGFQIIDDQQMRWGTNQIDGYTTKTITSGDTSRAIVAMRTDFDELEAFGRTEYEAQVYYGDSGGGVFYKRGDQWELAGIIHALSTRLNDLTSGQYYPNQPTGTVMLSSAPTGVANPTWNMYSYLSDLSAYRDQILGIITPMPGDASLDGLVNDVDASIVAAHWLMGSGALWEDGDFNADGQVNDQDAAILAAHWLHGAGEGATAAPEPAALVLLAGAAMMLLLRRIGKR